MKVWDEQEKRMWFVQSLHIEDEWIRANDGSIYGEKKDLVRNFKLLYPTAQTDKMVNLFIKEILLKSIIILYKQKILII